MRTIVTVQASEIIIPGKRQRVRMSRMRNSSGSEATCRVRHRKSADRATASVPTIISARLSPATSKIHSAAMMMTDSVRTPGEIDLGLACAPRMQQRTVMEGFKDACSRFCAAKVWPGALQRRAIDLKGPNALLCDEFFDGDIHGRAELHKIVAPLARPILAIAAPKHVVPDVLCLPQVDVHRQRSEAFGDGECFLQHGQILNFGAVLQSNHGPLHPFVGCKT